MSAIEKTVQNALHDAKPTHIVAGRHWRTKGQQAVRVRPFSGCRVAYVFKKGNKSKLEKYRRYVTVSSVLNFSACYSPGQELDVLFYRS